MGSVLLALTATSLLVTAPTSVVSAAAVEPAPIPARTGKPTTMAALGDSISQSTGTGQLSEENPKNSWATGGDVNSVRVRLGISAGNARNVSENGARMTHMDDQVLNGKSGGSGSVAAVDSSTQLVVIEIGGNDLCRDDIESMTSAADYRTQFRQALAAIKSRSPEALIFVMSVPDIYNLWYIRGAPKHPTYHPENESDQAVGGNFLNGARFYWSQSFFPCTSLLTNPGSWDDYDRYRREQVRARNIEFNVVLADECGKLVRCRFDDNRLFNFTSNRAFPPYGALLPIAQRAFNDNDISRNTGAGEYLCPVQGVIAGGCGDHFHPSKVGQGKLADSAMAAMFDFSDTTPPSLTFGTSKPARTDGSYPVGVLVTMAGADARGIRGTEYRVHRPNGSVTAWTEVVGSASGVTPPDWGTSYVEARAFDVNGNRSASTSFKVNVQPGAPAAPKVTSVSASSRRAALAWTAPTDNGGMPVTGYEVELTGSGSLLTSLPVPVAINATQVPVINGRLYRARIAARNAVGLGSYSLYSAPFVSPFGSVAGFVDQAYLDLFGRRATNAEAQTQVAALQALQKTPAQMIDGLVDAQAFGGVLGPVARLYQAYFLRLPDTGGMNYWAGRNRSGMSIYAISQQFAQSSEFVRRYGSLSNGAFVDLVYRNVLDRAPDGAGKSFWTSQLDQGKKNRGQVMVGFSESSEYKRVTKAQVDTVLAFMALVRRVPTAGESALHGPTPRSTQIQFLLASDAYANRVT